MPLVAGRLAMICASTDGAILHPQPPPCARLVKRIGTSGMFASPPLAGPAVEPALQWHPCRPGPRVAPCDRVRHSLRTPAEFEATPRPLESPGADLTGTTWDGCFTSKSVAAMEPKL